MFEDLVVTHAGAPGRYLAVEGGLVQVEVGLGSLEADLEGGMSLRAVDDLVLEVEGS